MKFRVNANFTNITGALALFYAMKIGVDMTNIMIWPCAVMILGRAVIPELVEMIKALIQLKTEGAKS